MAHDFFYKEHILITEKDYKTFNFSGGEVHVEFNPDTLEDINSSKNVIFNIRITNSDKLMQLILLNDILKRYGISTSCQLGYIPYARQDRETIYMGATSLKVFASLINSCNFENVYCLDPHSIVSENLINNLKIVNHNLAISLYVAHAGMNLETLTLLSPDLGAVKRVENVKKWMKTQSRYDKSPLDILIAHKHRNPATGAIESIQMIGDLPKGRDILVIDDIGDGLATFTELLNKTQLHKENNIHLWTTHGIYSKGIKIALDSGYKTLGTTNTVRENLEGLDGDKVFMYDAFDHERINV